MIVSPSATARLPSGQKSFCTSTTSMTARSSFMEQYLSQPRKRILHKPGTKFVQAPADGDLVAVRIDEAQATLGQLFQLFCAAVGQFVQRGRFGETPLPVCHYH